MTIMAPVQAPGREGPGHFSGAILNEPRRELDRASNRLDKQGERIAIARKHAGPGAFFLRACTKSLSPKAKKRETPALILLKHAASRGTPRKGPPLALTSIVKRGVRAGRSRLRGEKGPGFLFLLGRPPSPVLRPRRPMF
jgi:hypothetical protein